jgi:enoyl-CoA hydratase/carnithine racemase
MNAESIVGLEINGPVAQITLDNDAKRNALSRQMRKELLSQLQLVEQNDQIRVVVLTHAGKVFSSGMDLSEITPEHMEQDLTELIELIDYVEQFPKPLVVKFAGPVFAGGIGIIVAADFAVAQSGVNFSFSEVKIGVVPAVISKYVLRYLNPRLASRYLLTGEEFSAQQAKDCGLISDHCELEQLDAKLHDLIQTLLKVEPQAFKSTKELILNDRMNQASDEQVLKISTEFFLSENANEGRMALKEKRTPNWDKSS